MIEEIKRKSPKRQLRALRESSADNRKLQETLYFYHGFRRFARVGGHFLLLLVEVGCRWCGLRFYVCRRCWRGQAYCGEECRRLGRGRVHREAQRRYRQTAKGKKAHRQGENRRRHGLSKKNEKKMDDLSSQGLSLRFIKLLSGAPVLLVPGGTGFDHQRRCHFCGCKGRVVDRFPRRGGSRSSG